MRLIPGLTFFGVVLELCSAAPHPRDEGVTNQSPGMQGKLDFVRHLSGDAKNTKVTSQAVVNVELPKDLNIQDQQLTFQLQVLESTGACGFGNITIDEQILSQFYGSYITFGNGTLKTAHHSITAFWEFHCVDYNNTDAQLLKFVVESIDENPTVNTGFQVVFRQYEVSQIIKVVPNLCDLGLVDSQTLFPAPEPGTLQYYITQLRQRFLFPTFAFVAMCLGLTIKLAHRSCLNPSARAARQARRSARANARHLRRVNRRKAISQFFARFKRSRPSNQFLSAEEEKCILVQTEYRDDDAASTMTDEFAGLRTAVDLVDALVAAEEGRVRGVPEDVSHEQLPAYEERELGADRRYVDYPSMRGIGESPPEFSEK